MSNESLFELRARVLFDGAPKAYINQTRIATFVFGVAYENRRQLPDAVREALSRYPWRSRKPNLAEALDFCRWLRAEGYRPWGEG